MLSPIAVMTLAMFGNAAGILCAIVAGYLLRQRRPRRPYGQLPTAILTLTSILLVTGSVPFLYRSGFRNGATVFQEMRDEISRDRKLRQEAMPPKTDKRKKPTDVTAAMTR